MVSHRTVLEKIRNRIRSEKNYNSTSRLQRRLDKQQKLIAQSVEGQKEIIDEGNRELERKVLLRREQEKFLYGK